MNNVKYQEDIPIPLFLYIFPFTFSQILLVHWMSVASPFIFPVKIIK